MEHNKDKIKCSVGLLTFNSAKGLRACLDSLRDFEEIVICDGNSTDETLAIADEYGAKVIKQYDTHIPNTPCVKDKATVRQKNMDASTLSWYFFMDSDDTLSGEVVREIREIVSNNNPEFLVYRMPTRIFIDNKEILHEASYPSYQIRLVHKSIHPLFKGDVHERVVFDESRYSIGTLHNFYNFHWSKERVEHFKKYLGNYARWETEFVDYTSFFNFLYKGVYRRVGIILKYLFYRLPKMYLKFGFKDSMPLSIELTIVWYHAQILFRLIYEYIRTRRWAVFVSETLKGKDIYRIITNYALLKTEISREILDIGSGEIKASYYRFLRLSKWHHIESVDIDPKRKPTIVCDMTKSPLPVLDSSKDFVLAFNVFEHLGDRMIVLNEVFRVLKKGGTLLGCVPFLVNVHPDPQDFVRMAHDELDLMFKKAGFENAVIIPVGNGPFTAGYSMVEWIFPRILKILIYPVFAFFDFFLKKIWKKSNLVSKYPLAYMFFAKK